MDNIDTLKQNPAELAQLKYKLKHADVYVSPTGYHFIDYLDPVAEISPEIDHTKLTAAEVAYIEQTLQSNSRKFEKQVRIVKSYLQTEGAKVLDIGCGGGLFLSLLKAAGSEVTGIELSDSRAHYAMTRHGIEVHKRSIESDFWQSQYIGHFDAVTIWDVIDQVNYPFATLQSASKVLRKDGFLFVATRCRDSFYHRVGEVTYAISAGRYPTILNSMYSARQFGYKHIFSTDELSKLFDGIGLDVVELAKFHEISFPYEFYLNKVTRSKTLIRVSLPLVKLFFSLFQMKNKVLIVGRKR